MKVLLSLMTACCLSFVSVSAFGQEVAINRTNGLLAQAQTSVSYGAHLQDGLKQENLRHSQVMTQLQQERNNANAAFKIQANHCSNGNSKNYQKCITEAQRTLRSSLSAINDKQITENMLHANSILTIRQYWQGQMTYSCNRPDCVNSKPGKDLGCSNGSCH